MVRMLAKIGSWPLPAQRSNRHFLATDIFILTTFYCICQHSLTPTELRYGTLDACSSLLTVFGPQTACAVLQTITIRSLNYSLVAVVIWNVLPDYLFSTVRSAVRLPCKLSNFSLGSGRYNPL